MNNEFECDENISDILLTESPPKQALSNDLQNIIKNIPILSKMINDSYRLNRLLYAEKYRFRQQYQRVILLEKTLADTRDALNEANNRANHWKACYEEAFSECSAMKEELILNRIRLIDEKMNKNCIEPIVLSNNNSNNNKINNNNNNEKDWIPHWESWWQQISNINHQRKAEITSKEDFVKQIENMLKINEKHVFSESQQALLNSIDEKIECYEAEIQLQSEIYSKRLEELMNENQQNQNYNSSNKLHKK